MPRRLFEERYALVVDVLATARSSAGVTQTELAKRLGRMQSYVSKVERRERHVDVVEFYDWLSALGVEPTRAYESLVSRLRDGPRISDAQSR